MPDKLDTILHLQKALQERLGYDFDGMGMREKTAYIKEYILHCEHELHELVQELPYFKPWKPNDGTYQEMQLKVNRAKEEYIDVLHFFVNIGLALGMAATDIYDGFIDKNLLNHNRQQQEGYTRCVDETTAKE